MTNKPIAIIGAGNGGQTTAAWLSNQGYQTRIFDVMEDTVAKLNELGGVNIYGNTDFPGFGKIQFATTDIAKAIDGCEVIFIILPEIYHVSIAQKLAPHLVDGQIVVIDPVSGLGILAFKKALAEAGCKADISLAATSTLLFAARIQTTGDVFVTGQKTELSIVAIPNSKREIIKEAIYPVFSQHHFIDNSIQLALDNLNLIFHPGPTLLYTAQIEKGEKFNYYNDMVPSQITLMKALDQERMAICAAYGVKLPDAEAAFALEYSYEGDLYTMLKNAECYKGIMGPNSLQVRYLLEDVPFSLRSVQILGKIAKVPTPVIDSVCTIGEALVGDVMAEGYTMEALGLSEDIGFDEFVALCNGWVESMKKARPESDTDRAFCYRFRGLQPAEESFVFSQRFL